MSDLTPRDLAMFRRLRITPELLAKAGVARVSDLEARDLLGPNGAHGDMAGIAFPYFSPQTGFRVAARVRRDNPEIEDGKARNKYRSGYGDRHHLYLPRVAAELLADLSTPIVLVEAEKSALEPPREPLWQARSTYTPLVRFGPASSKDTAHPSRATN